MRIKSRIIVSLLIFAISLNICSFAYAPKQQFSDIQSHWSKSIVLKLLDYGLVSGYKDNTFKPENSINGDEFIKIVLNCMGMSFSTDHPYWAQEYIEKAVELGMIDSEGYYGYPITREKMARIVTYALKSKPSNNFENAKALIYDYAEVSDDYKEFVLIVYDSRIMTGYDNDSFRPKSFVTRAEAAVTVVRLIDKNGGIAETGSGIAGSENGLNIPSVNAAQSLYVSLSGSDSNDGSEKSPFKTISKAKDTVRAMIQAGNLPDDGVNVFIREGTYYQYESLVFEEEDSGTEKGKITYTAYPGEKVRISGGIPIRKEWFKPIDDTEKAKLIEKSASSKVLVCDLKANGIEEYGELNTRGYHIFNKGQYMPAELIVNGNNQTLARYPNTETITVKDENLIPDELGFKYDFDRPSKWTNAEDPWLVGTLAINYENNAYPIKKIDTANKKILLREGKIRNYYTNGWFFAENLMEEIDTQGEYYIDRVNGKLYYYPPADFASKEQTIELSTLKKPMFTFNGAKNIVVSNLILESGRGYAALATTKGYEIPTYGEFLLRNNVTNPLTFDPESKATTKLRDPKYYPEAQVFPGHIWDGFLDRGEGVTGIEFLHNEVRNFGSGGFIVRGTKVKINNNHITNIGGTGLFLMGGDMETLESSENEIMNNNIHRIGYQHRAYNPAIAIQGVGCRVAYNDVYDAPHCVINYHGNDHIIEYNKIHDAVKECLDMDAIYTRNEYIPQWRGTVIRFNHIYNMGIFPVGEYQKQFNISGIRTDNYGHALQIYNNIFSNIGTSSANSVIAITAQGNRNMIIGNLFLDCATTFRGWDTFSPGATWDLTNEETKKRLELAKKYSQIPIFAEKYPELATFDKEFYKSVATNTFESNLVVNLKFKLSETNGMPNKDSTRGAPELIVSKENQIMTANPGFVDYEGGDYTLMEGSEILGELPQFKNFKMSDFGPQEKVGPVN